MTERKCVIDETITCEDFKCDNCPVKDAYNYGLAEGRKEKCLEQNSDGTIRPCEVMKENEQLKAQIELYKEMLERNPCVVTPYWNCSDCLEENAKLKQQIEKMKCCGNCKHENDSNTNYYCEDCKRFAFETEIEKWELATDEDNSEVMTRDEEIERRR